MDRSSSSYPQVIFFDAVGTLFGIRGSVGDIYSQIASKYGVIAEPKALNTAFGAVFSRTPSLTFDGGKLPQESLYRKEYQWWYGVACSTFERANLLDKFTDFELFFQELYVYFSTKKPWYIYPEVIDCLKKYQQKKIELGIISNFDSRIYQVLKLLEIESYFSSITISSEVGMAKPESSIFRIALAKHRCTPELAWHVGDSFRDDYQGAKNVGIRAFLLERDKPQQQVENSLPNLNSLG